jgi:tRNA (guanine-N7-)-methyltransferase
MKQEPNPRGGTSERPPALETNSTGLAASQRELDRSIRSYNARRGRLRSGALDALERLWPKWGVDGNEPVDFKRLFPGSDGVVVEIGSGMGEATVAMAAADPRRGILAIDVHTPGLGSLLRDCERNGLTNVRVSSGDAVALLHDCIAPASVSEIRIYFPDPWPKARHKKRRLINPAFAQLAVSRLIVGGRIHCATDWIEYGEQMLEVLSDEPRLRNDFAGFAPRPSYRPVTKFESKGLERGHTIVDLIFTRVR